MSNAKYQRARAEVGSLTRIVIRQAEQLADKDEIVSDLKSRLRKMGADARGHGENQKVRVNALKAKQAELVLAIKQRDEARAELDEVNQALDAQLDLVKVLTEESDDWREQYVQAAKQRDEAKEATRIALEAMQTADEERDEAKRKLEAEEFNEGAVGAASLGWQAKAKEYKAELARLREDMERQRQRYEERGDLIERLRDDYADVVIERDDARQERAAADKAVQALRAERDLLKAEVADLGSLTP